MKPAIYTRVSSALQAQNNADDAQRHAIEQWAKGANLTIPASDWYSDLAVSGRKMKRPGLDALMVRIKAGEFDTLVAYSLSRIARNARGCLEVIDTLKEHKVRLVLLKENVDTATPAGRMFLTFMAAMAEYEADVTAERAASGIRAHIAKGRKWGGALVTPGSPGGPKFSPEQAESIRAEIRAGGKPWQIAKRLGVRYVTIKKLVG